MLSLLFNLCCRETKNEILCFGWANVRVGDLIQTDDSDISHHHFVYLDP